MKERRSSYLAGEYYRLGTPYFREYQTRLGHPKNQPDRSNQNTKKYMTHRKTN